MPNPTAVSTEEEISKDALAALREVENKIAMQAACSSPEGECYQDHQGCYVADSLRIVREALAPFEPKTCPSRYIIEALADPVQDERMKCTREKDHGGRHINQSCDLAWDPGAEISARAILVTEPRE